MKDLKGASAVDENFDASWLLHRAIELEDLDHVKTVLQGYKKFECKNDDGLTALCLAAKKGNVPIIRVLIDAGFQPTETSSSSKIPLMYAMEKNHLPAVAELLKAQNICEHATIVRRGFDKTCHTIVKALLDHGADVAAVDNNGWNSLHHAVSSKNKEVVLTLAEKLPDINAKNNDGHTALHMAITRDAVEVVKVLLEHRASPGEVIRVSGQTPLHLSIATKNVEMVRLLLSATTNLGAVDKQQRNCLHYAAEAGVPEIISMLLPNVKNKNGTDKMGNTPLHVAIQNGHTAVVKLLLQAKVSTSIISKIGRTPLHEAVLKRNSSIVEALSKVRASVTVVDKEGLSPLHYAAAQGDVDILEMLFKVSSNKNPRDRDGNTLLLTAVKNGQLGAVNMLLKYGAECNSKDGAMDAETSLHVAVRTKRLDIVQSLVRSKAKISIATGYSANTPLHYAVEAKHVEICKFLIKNKASLDQLNKEKKSAADLARETNFDFEKGCLESSAKEAKPIKDSTAENVSCKVESAEKCTKEDIKGVSKKCADKDVCDVPPEKLPEFIRNVYYPDGVPKKEDEKGTEPMSKAALIDSERDKYMKKEADAAVGKEEKGISESEDEKGRNAKEKKKQQKVNEEKKISSKESECEGKEKDREGDSNLKEKKEENGKEKKGDANKEIADIAKEKETGTKKKKKGNDNNASESNGSTEEKTKVDKTDVSKKEAKGKDSKSDSGSLKENQKSCDANVSSPKKGGKKSQKNNSKMKQNSLERQSPETESEKIEKKDEARPNDIESQSKHEKDKETASLKNDEVLQRRTESSSVDNIECGNENQSNVENTSKAVELVSRNSTSSGVEIEQEKGTVKEELKRNTEESSEQKNTAQTSVKVGSATETEKRESVEGCAEKDMWCDIEDDQQRAEDEGKAAKKDYYSLESFDNVEVFEDYDDDEDEEEEVEDEEAYGEEEEEKGAPEKPLKDSEEAEYTSEDDYYERRELPFRGRGYSRYHYDRPSYHPGRGRSSWDRPPRFQRTDGQERGSYSARTFRSQRKRGWSYDRPTFHHGRRFGRGYYERRYDSRYDSRSTDSKYDSRSTDPRYDSRDGDSRYDSRNTESRYESRNSESRYDTRSSELRYSRRNSESSRSRSEEREKPKVSDNRKTEEKQVANEGSCSEKGVTVSSDDKVTTPQNKVDESEKEKSSNPVQQTKDVPSDSASPQPSNNPMDFMASLPGFTGKRPETMPANWIPGPMVLPPRFQGPYAPMMYYPMMPKPRLPLVCNSTQTEPAADSSDPQVDECFNISVLPDMFKDKQLLDISVLEAYNKKECLLRMGAELRARMEGGAELPGWVLPSTAFMLLCPWMEVPMPVILDDFLSSISETERQLILKVMILYKFLTQQEFHRFSLLLRRLLPASSTEFSCDSVKDEVVKAVMQFAWQEVYVAQLLAISNIRSGFNKGGKIAKEELWSKWISSFEGGKHLEWAAKQQQQNALDEKLRRRLDIAVIRRHQLDLANFLNDIVNTYKS